MGRRDPRRRAPPGDRDELRRAFLLVAADPHARPRVPYAHFIDQLERRYGQPPGSARGWDVEDFVRAAEFYRLENAPQKRKVK